MATKEGTELEYNLNCLIDMKRVSVVDGDRRYESKLIHLIPDDSTERTKFLIAWRPEVSTEYFELGIVLPYPVECAARAAIMRGGDKHQEKPYLSVMTKGAAEILENMVGKRIKVLVLPEGDDAEGEIDKAKDSGGDFDLIHGQTDFGQ